MLADCLLDQLGFGEPGGLGCVVKELGKFTVKPNADGHPVGGLGFWLGFHFLCAGAFRQLPR
jgi:hypothetical protein